MQAEYVIIGAGSAGCVLADRLSESGASVVLLEAGGRDRNPFIHIPAGILKLLYHPVVNWNYASEPEEGSGNRAIHWPRGKVLGGSSSINGMLYVRGNPADYDGWAQRGCRGWSYDDVLPYFKMAEAYAGDGDDSYRGRGGPVAVEDYRTILPLTHHFIEAAGQAGFEHTPDLNGAQQEGASYSQMTRAGRFRASTAQTYLKRARGRENLTIVTGAQAGGLLIDGHRCTGVRYRQNGQEREVLASREVILSGGAINSPHLLQVSGIGPAEHLKSIGVEVRHDLPGVGGNLSDHYVVRVSHRVKDQITINQLARGLRLTKEVGRYVFQGNGALTFGVTSANVFCRSRPELASPDLQLLFTPASYDLQVFGTLEKAPGMTMAVCVAQPQSRGSIMAASADPYARPLIRPNYLAAEEDLRALKQGVRLARDIFAQPALAAHSLGEIEPGTTVDGDDALNNFARDAGTTIYHPVGTCKMGEDPQAVVDSRLKVNGIAGLRVADASVMPVVTTGNTNAPTIMIGEKAAKMILEDRAA